METRAIEPQRGAERVEDGGRSPDRPGGRRRRDGGRPRRETVPPEDDGACTVPAGAKHRLDVVA
jgi:hypothetical protein